MQIGSNDIPIRTPETNPATLEGLSPEERDLKHAQTAKKFEELIATMLIKELRKGLSEGFFGDGPGSDTFNGWRAGTWISPEWSRPTSA